MNLFKKLIHEIRFQLLYREILLARRRILAPQPKRPKGPRGPLVGKSASMCHIDDPGVN